VSEPLWRHSGESRQGRRRGVAPLVGRRPRRLLVAAVKARRPRGKRGDTAYVPGPPPARRPLLPETLRNFADNALVPSGPESAQAVLMSSPSYVIGRVRHEAPHLFEESPVRSVTRRDTERFGGRHSPATAQRHDLGDRPSIYRHGQQLAALDSAQHFARVAVSVVTIGEL
jgi:hypothetical protein